MRAVAIRQRRAAVRHHGLSRQSADSCFQAKLRKRQVRGRHAPAQKLSARNQSRRRKSQAPSGTKPARFRCQKSDALRPDRQRAIRRIARLAGPASPTTALHADGLRQVSTGGRRSVPAVSWQSQWAICRECRQTGQRFNCTGMTDLSRYRPSVTNSVPGAGLKKRTPASGWAQNRWAYASDAARVRASLRAAQGRSETVRVLRT